jgi:hypothetical protein
MGFSKMKRTIEMIVVNPKCEIKRFKSRQFVNKIKNTIVGFILFSLLCLILNNLESVQAILQAITIKVI